MKAFVVATAAIAGAGYALYTTQQHDVDRVVEADREGIVVVRAPAGAITIEGWDRSEVRIRGSAGDESDDVRISTARGHTEIVVPGRAASGDTELTVRIPAASSLDVESDAADVRVDDVEGVVRLASRSGDFTVAGRPLGIVARSRTGDIDVGAEGVPGIVYSEDGDVTLRGRAAETISQADPRARRRDRRTDPCGGTEQCERLEEMLAAQAEHLGEMGEHIGAAVAAALAGIEFNGGFDFGEMDDGYRFDLAGDVQIDREELAKAFEELEAFFEEFGQELGETMADLGQELEALGEELQRKR